MQSSLDLFFSPYTESRPYEDSGHNPLLNISNILFHFTFHKLHNLANKFICQKNFFENFLIYMCRGILKCTYMHNNTLSEVVHLQKRNKKLPAYKHRSSRFSSKYIRESTCLKICFPNLPDKTLWNILVLHTHTHNICIPIKMTKFFAVWC